MEILYAFLSLLCALLLLTPPSFADVIAEPPLEAIREPLLPVALVVLVVAIVVFLILRMRKK